MTAYAAPSELDVFDVACLAEGTGRVVDTALVAVVQSGRVRVAAPGELASASRDPRHRVEAAVLDAVGSEGRRSVDSVRWRLTTDERVLDVARRLRDAGLLGSGGGPGARGGRWRLTATYAGRSLLHALRDAPPAAALAQGTEALTVALHGRERMTDQELCAAIFEQPATAVGHGLPRRPHATALADALTGARQGRAEVPARA